MRKQRATFGFLLIIWIVSFPTLNGLNQALANEWFDSYDSKISQREEYGRLDNFAIYLQDNPDSIGYIAFYTGEKDKLVNIKSHVQRAKKYLVSKRNIASERIVIVNAGKRYDDSVIVLQPVSANSEIPKF